MAACAIFKNEASYLAEWLDFHRLMGVEEFYLYDNGSTDNWHRVVRRHITAGRVHVTRWPAPQRVAQLTAYRHCLDHRRSRPRWIAFIDIDEFLFSPTGRPLPEVLSAFASHPGVIAAWRVYGTGGWKKRPDGLVTESYLTRAAEDHFLSAFGKPVVDPRQTVSLVTSPHAFPHYQSRRPWRLQSPVDETGAPFSGLCTSAEVLRINHYYAKSEDEAIAKVSKGSVTHDPAYSIPLQQILDPRLNDVHDDAIVQFLPDLHRQLGRRNEVSLAE